MNHKRSSDYAYKMQVVKQFKHLQEISPIYKYVGDPSLFNSLKRFGDLKGKEILDFGCGLGMYAEMFAKMGASYVLGTDISEECLEIAQSKVSLRI